MLTFLVALVPSAGALFLFWVVLRAILQADRRERLAVARYEAAQARTADRRTSSEGASVADENLTGPATPLANSPHARDDDH